MMHEWGFAWGIGPLGMLVFAALVVWPFWRICEKAGFAGVLSMLVFIPLVNLFFLYWFAFADWPSLQRDGRP